MDSPFYLACVNVFPTERIIALPCQDSILGRVHFSHLADAVRERLSATMCVFRANTESLFVMNQQPESKTMELVRHNQMVELPRMSWVKLESGDLLYVNRQLVPHPVAVGVHQVHIPALAPALQPANGASASPSAPAPAPSPTDPPPATRTTVAKPAAGKAAAKVGAKKKKAPAGAAAAGRPPQRARRSRAGTTTAADSHKRPPSPSPEPKPKKKKRQYTPPGEMQLEPEGEVSPALTVETYWRKREKRATGGTSRFVWRKLPENSPRIAMDRLQGRVFAIVICYDGDKGGGGTARWDQVHIGFSSGSLIESFPVTLHKTVDGNRQLAACIAKYNPPIRAGIHAVKVTAPVDSDAGERDVVYTEGCFRIQSGAPAIFVDKVQPVIDRLVEQCVLSYNSLIAEKQTAGISTTPTSFDSATKTTN